MGRAWISCWVASTQRTGGDPMGGELMGGEETGGDATVDYTTNTIISWLIIYTY